MINNFRLRVLSAFWIILVGMAVFSGCSSTQKKLDDKTVSPNSDLSLLMDLAERAKDSSVDIQYTLGSFKRGFHLKSNGGTKAVSVHSTLGKEVLKTGQISLEKYPEFLRKVLRFVHRHRVRDGGDRSAAARPGTGSSGSGSESQCRNPFMVTVHLQGMVQTAKGCRSSDDGSLSRIVKEGEFLMFAR